jgi:hypothetical protein
MGTRLERAIAIRADFTLRTYTHLFSQKDDDAIEAALRPAPSAGRAT